MAQVAYRVLSPLKRDGKLIPVGGTATFAGDDEEQVELATLGVIDGASGVAVAEEKSSPTSPPPPPPPAATKGGKRAGPAQAGGQS